MSSHESEYRAALEDARAAVQRSDNVQEPTIELRGAVRALIQAVGALGHPLQVVTRDESPFAMPEMMDGYPLSPSEQEAVDRIVSANDD